MDSESTTIASKPAAGLTTGEYGHSSERALSHAAGGHPQIASATADPITTVLRHPAPLRQAAAMISATRSGKTG